MKLLTPFAIAGASFGLGLVGSEIKSEPLVEAGETSGKFIAPAVNISMGGYLINKIRKFKKL